MHLLVALYDLDMSGEAYLAWPPLWAWQAGRSHSLLRGRRSGLLPRENCHGKKPWWIVHSLAMRCRRVVHAELTPGAMCLAASPAAVRRLQALAIALLSAAGSTDSSADHTPGVGRAASLPDPRQPHPDPRQRGPGRRQPCPGNSQPAGMVCEGLAPPAAPATVLALQVSVPSLSLRLAAAEAAGLGQAGAAQGLSPPMLRVVARGLNAAVAAEADQLDLRCAAQRQYFGCFIRTTLWVPWSGKYAVGAPARHCTVFMHRVVSGCHPHQELCGVLWPCVKHVFCCERRVSAASLVVQDVSTSPGSTGAPASLVAVPLLRAAPLGPAWPRCGRRPVQQRFFQVAPIHQTPFGPDLCMSRY